MIVLFFTGVGVSDLGAWLEHPRITPWGWIALLAPFAVLAIVLIIHAFAEQRAGAKTQIA